MSEFPEYYDKSIQSIVDASIKKNTEGGLDLNDYKELFKLKIPTGNSNFINNVITKLLPDDYTPPVESGTETPPGGGSRRRRKNLRNSKRKRK